jgi:hypothetical protein
MASLLWIIRLNKVDFPTFGLPTMATIALIHLKFGAKVVLIQLHREIMYYLKVKTGKWEVILNYLKDHFKISYPYQAHGNYCIENTHSTEKFVHF